MCVPHPAQVSFGFPQSVHPRQTFPRRSWSSSDIPHDRHRGTQELQNNVLFHLFSTVSGRVHCTQQSNIPGQCLSFVYKNELVGCEHTHIIHPIGQTALLLSVYKLWITYETVQRTSPFGQPVRTSIRQRR